MQANDTWYYQRNYANSSSNTVFFLPFLNAIFFWFVIDKWYIYSDIIDCILSIYEISIIYKTSKKKKDLLSFPWLGDVEASLHIGPSEIIFARPWQDDHKHQGLSAHSEKRIKLNWRIKSSKILKPLICTRYINIACTLWSWTIEILHQYISTIHLISFISNNQFWRLVSLFRIFNSVA